MENEVVMRIGMPYSKKERAEIINSLYGVSGCELAMFVGPDKIKFVGADIDIEQIKDLIEGEGFSVIE